MQVAELSNCMNLLFYWSLDRIQLHAIYGWTRSVSVPTRCPSKWRLISVQLCRRVMCVMLQQASNEQYNVVDIRPHFRSGPSGPVHPWQRRGRSSQDRFGPPKQVQPVAGVTASKSQRQRVPLRRRTLGAGCVEFQFRRIHFQQDSQPFLLHGVRLLPGTQRYFTSLN